MRTYQLNDKNNVNSLRMWDVYLNTHTHTHTHILYSPSIIYKILCNISDVTTNLLRFAAITHVYILSQILIFKTEKS